LCVAAEDDDCLVRTIGSSSLVCFDLNCLGFGFPSIGGDFLEVYFGMTPWSSQSSLTMCDFSGVDICPIKICTNMILKNYLTH
jgi:hypothetical protein